MDYSNIGSRYFPDVVAVDPQGCGCTECLTGEYKPSEIWFSLAKPADVVAIFEGYVHDHTYYGFDDLVDAYNYQDKDTIQFLRDFEKYQQEEQVLRSAFANWQVEKGI